MSFVRDGPVAFFTRKEPWVLFALWLGGPASAEALAERLFAGAKNPRKRVQVAVHHVREALGEAWIRWEGELYRAAPLPGTWWDAGLLERLVAAGDRVPAWGRDAWHEALRVLHRGPLLPGAPFDAERERVARGLSRTRAPSD
jgi:hypothetical protein